MAGRGKTQPNAIMVSEYCVGKWKTERGREVHGLGGQADARGEEQANVNGLLAT